jgi:predicted nucleic acid-binding protein
VTAVVDASVVVAALIDDGPVGRWVAELVVSTPLAAPRHMPVEAANILRRVALAGDVSDDIASLAHADLVAPSSCSLTTCSPSGSGNSGGRSPPMTDGTWRWPSH